jgi:hypothetical protein
MAPRTARASSRADRRRSASTLVFPLAALLAATGLSGCDDGRETLAPGLGDFVQTVIPADGAVLSANKFGESAVTVLLNFLAAEGRFGFGSLSSFSFDGDDVGESVLILNEGGPPPDRTTLTYERSQIHQGEHEIEVEYADSRGVVHRFGWSFTIQD